VLGSYRDLRSPALAPLASLLRVSTAGCRTFSARNRAAHAVSLPRVPRDVINAVARRIADRSARFAPKDPAPRPFGVLLSTS